MTMYKQQQPKRSKGLASNKSERGERIELKVERILSNKETIRDGAPLTYTERKDGVRPDADIRTDKWDAAIDAMDTISDRHRKKREERAKGKVVNMEQKKEEGAQGQSSTGGEEKK